MSRAHPGVRPPIVFLPARRELADKLTFRLLCYLMLNAGRVVTKDQILDQVWNYAFDGSGAIVETYIYYLRRKLGALGPPLIRTGAWCRLFAASTPGVGRRRSRRAPLSGPGLAISF